jgi:hypothetical protein
VYESGFGTRLSGYEGLLCEVVEKKVTIWWPSVVGFWGLAGL